MKLAAYENLKLKYKLTISYFVIIIPLVLVFVFFANRITTYISNQLKYSVEQTLQQTNSFLSYKLDSIMKIGQIISRDQRIQEIVNKNQGNFDIYSNYGDYMYLKQYIASFETPKDIYKVRLYVPDDFIYANENDIAYNMSDIKDTPFHQRLVDSGKSYLFYSNNDTKKQDYEEDVKLLSVMHNISSPNDYTQSIGAIRVDFYEENINEILKKNDVVRGSITYIQNSIGEIITSSRDINSLPIDKKTNLKYGWNSMNLNHNHYYVGKLRLGMTDWDLMVVVPFYEIQFAGKNFMTTLTLSILFIGTIVYVLAYFISTSITKKLDIVIKKFKNVENGDLSKIDSIYTRNTDEVGQLMKYYNYMVTKIDELIDTQCKSAQEIKSAELRILQAQINPHFLYNTLDLVRWLGLKNMCAEIIDIVQSLSSFYRLSLNNGRNTLSIKDELQHVSSYVQIQNIRFSNKLHLVIDVDSNILNIQIPKTILQPIVENSILHGILNKPDKEGKIIIEGMLFEDTIVINIIDDGIGIEAEKLELINKGIIESTRSGGFGIKNIMERITLTYGNPYGLKYERTEEETKATITIPRISEDFT